MKCLGINVRYVKENLRLLTDANTIVPLVKVSTTGNTTEKKKLKVEKQKKLKIEQIINGFLGDLNVKPKGLGDFM